jgi:hypothetical protein
MTDEARMADDGCTNEAEPTFVNDVDVRKLLTIIEELAYQVGIGSDGEGTDSTVQEALSSHYDAAALAHYERMRARYPNI